MEALWYTGGLDVAGNSQEAERVRVYVDVMRLVCLGWVGVHEVVVVVGEIFIGVEQCLNVLQIHEDTTRWLRTIFERNPALDSLTCDVVNRNLLAILVKERELVEVNTLSYAGLFSVENLVVVFANECFYKDLPPAMNSLASVVDPDCKYIIQGYKGGLTL